MWTFVAVLVFLTAGHNAQNCDNSVRGVLRCVCPDKHVVSQIKSSYSHRTKARRWKIDCKAFGAAVNCSWSGFHDLHEEGLKYNCPANHVVAGVHSNYNSTHGDRSWSFLCCSSPNLITSECRDTPMVNYWKEDFDWQLPGGQLLTGIQTHRESNNGDDRWSFTYCEGRLQDTQPITSQIFTRNEPMKDLLTEGDIFVPRTRTARNAVICSNCRWQKLSDTVEVPYDVSPSFTSSEKITINDAISAFHMSTCVRFVPRVAQSDYISIVKLTGCWSSAGRTGGAQQLSLGAGCVQHGIVQHELIHALGFWHEQNRNDRDTYVRINYENILDGYAVNFDRQETNNLAVPYDYSSVMHYAAKDFSKNGGDTITPLTPSAQIGQRVSMSENDILKINKLYDCRGYLHEYGNWDNQLLTAFTRQCPSGQAVSGFTSLFNNDQKDRLWAIPCKNFKVAQACQWSNYVNEYWGAMDFKCGLNAVISGAYSEYSTLFQERRWKFFCCRAPDFVTSNCQKTPVINYFKETFSWTVAGGNFITGVKSSFDASTRDRRWSFSYCQGNV